MADDITNDEAYRTILRPLDLRRAILGVYLRVGRPLTINEVLRRLEEDHLDLSNRQRSSARQKVSEVMCHQVRSGRAEMLDSRVFVVNPGAFSASTRYRCLHWRQVAECRGRRYRWRS